eukprot:sb/3472656/
MASWDFNIDKIKVCNLLDVGDNMMECSIRILGRYIATKEPTLKQLQLVAITALFLAGKQMKLIKSDLDFKSAALKGSKRLKIQSDPDLVALDRDLVAPRFSDRINYPRYRDIGNNLAALKGSKRLKIQSDPDLVALDRDLVAPRFSDRINYPRYRDIGNNDI